MTKVVGVDFGTTNIRIAQLDLDDGGNPTSLELGSVNPLTMPAVIAFERQESSEVTLKFGEEADALDDGPNVQVVRNIKRYVLTSDKHVRQNYEWDVKQQGKFWPKWFDPDTNSIRLWNETISVEEAVRLILKEAIAKAGLAGLAAEWRAGCPVSSDLAYRESLVSALSDLGCTGKIEWISQEPLLLLALGKAIGSLVDGYYIVYDLGGGSFDCTAVEVRNNELIVLAEEGLSALGGMDIDDKLREQLDYTGSDQLLRIAKEQLSSEVERIPLGGGLELTNDDVGKVLDDLKFMDETLATMVNAFKKAQILREAPYDSATTGKGWRASIDAMSREVDKVLVVGGPTRMPYFTEKLGSIFGDAKVMTADVLTQNAGRADIADPALTALSHGACYMYGNTYIPLMVDRIPARISLKVSDRFSTEEDTYEPFEKFPLRPLAPYEGLEVIRRTLYDDESTQLVANRSAIFWVRVTSPDGDTLFDTGPLDMRMPRESHTGPRVDRISLAVDRLGGVKVRLSAGSRDLGSAMESVQVVFSEPPWQPDLPSKKSYLDRGQERLEKDKAYRERELPYGGSVHAAYGDSQRRA